MASTDLTPAAQQLAHCWARTLNQVDRCQQAIQDGDWVYLNDQAGQLTVLADEVSAAAAALTRDETATGPAELLAAIQANREQPGE